VVGIPNFLLYCFIFVLEKIKVHKKIKELPDGRDVLFQEWYNPLQDSFAGSLEISGPL
jgi:hypothetical protein